ncbi:MAG: HDOD domain-containing protein [Gammaproteobacteria bacterium]|nr:HDOD domain-containing protein [Gammaproteobacteria bacterium]
MTDKTLTEQVNIVISTLQDDIKQNKLDLPSAPDLLIKLRRLTASSYTTANQVAELIKYDTNISGRLIKVANSALFGVRNQVTTVQAAITRLGQKRVQSLVIGLLIGQKLLESKTLGLEQYCQQAWQASNNVAAISFVLASTKTDIDPEQALLAGMVHNIGTLPLLIKLNKIESLKNKPKILRLVAEAVIPKLYAGAGRLILKS